MAQAGYIYKITTFLPAPPNQPLTPAGSQIERSGQGFAGNIVTMYIQDFSGELLLKVKDVNGNAYALNDGANNLCKFN